MPANTNIEWCDATWNPVTGCTPISEGCQNCWAKRMAKRLAGRCGYPADDPFRVTFHPDRLKEPLRWKKPMRIAVSLMGDLFHEDVPDEWIWKVVEECYRCPQHTFMFLTKRPERMYDTLTRSSWWNNDTPENICLGVSVENQKTADERLQWLRKCPAAVRVVSLEPLLGAIPQLPLKDIHWVIVGGESGPGARPMHPDWARSVRDQCQAAGVPYFFKQWGEWWPMPLTRPNEQWSYPADGKKTVDVEGLRFRRVGKKAAGRMLDGREWNEIPAP